MSPAGRIDEDDHRIETELAGSLIQVVEVAPVVVIGGGLNGAPRNRVADGAASAADDVLEHVGDPLLLSRVRLVPTGSNERIVVAEPRRPLSSRLRGGENRQASKDSEIGG